MKNTKEEGYNLLDKYSSSVKHILIPLPNFKRYHQTESETLTDDSGFVGRQAIISKLKSWLANKDTLTGAYLITGFRGMGKSSFVGKVLNELTQHHQYIKERYYHFVKGGLLSVTYLCCIFYVCGIAFEGDAGRYLALGIILGSVLLGGVILYFLHIKKQREYLKSSNQKRKVNNGEVQTEYIPVRINIGNELLAKNDEIMKLIIKSVYDTFSDYTKRPAKHLLYSYSALCLQLLFIWGIMTHLAIIKISPTDYEDVNGTLRGINDAFLFLINRYSLLFAALGCFCLYLVSIYLIEKLSLLIDHFHLLGLTTLSGIKKQMYDLYLRSIASIDEDYSTSLQYIPAIFKKKKYEKATVREMEQALIAVFEKLQEMYCSIFHMDIRFIIVLDEMDKVETSNNDDMLNKDNDDNQVPFYESSITGFPGTMNARKRRQELMRTLANMKYFLSTVKAKFIFIAGRELYDAYLADVSDREFAISSVFDGVVNVNSFFKAGDYSKDITGMTEEYICNRLMPEQEEGKRNLASYFQYLNKANPDKKDRHVRNVIFLYQYILYLAHLSNGSPKKIAVYFEKDIRTRDYLTVIKEYALEENDCMHYLSFGVKDIQKIRFMHYISYPIMQAMVSKSKIYEDKLLVSTSFMINHLYKYHNTGFSWRNLEHIPELLDMNKTPELRDFLGTIIAFLRQTHLSPIQSGLYLFKFPMKISEEISFLSKRIEGISALFHFSKDESLPVKKHYMRLLKYYTEKCNQITGEELHTLASIHHILADIYQADEDYSQAIYEHLTGLQLLSKQLTGTDYDKDAHWISYMLFLIRNMLKLGTAYEKRKTFDSAYSAYSELEKKLIDYRDFNEKDLKLEYNFEWDNSTIGKNAVLYQDVCIDGNQTKDELFLVKEWKDSPDYQYAFQANRIGSEFSRILSPVKYAILMRQSFFYDLRLAYLPTLAKLFVLEKMDTEGITQNNIDLAEAEFFYLHVFVDDSDKPMVYADFFQKLGDIMYYKNGLIEERCNNLFQAVSLNGFDLKGLIDKICKLLQSEAINTYYYNRKKIEQLFIQGHDKIGLTSCQDVKSIAEKICEVIGNNSLQYRIERLLHDLRFNSYSDKRLQGCMSNRRLACLSGRKIPCYACKYYNMSLDSILDQILHYHIDRTKSRSVNIMVWLLKNRSQIRGYKEVYLLLMGNTVKGLANVMLGCSNQKDRISDSFLEKLTNSFKVFYGNGSINRLKIFNENDSDLNALEKSLLLYMETAMFFDIAGNKNNAAQMFRQILEVLNFYLRICRSEEIIEKERNTISKHLDNIEEIVNYVIMLLYGYCDGVNILEIDKFKKLCGKDIDEGILLNQIPFSPDIEELIYRYYSLKIRCGVDECIKSIYRSNMMGGYKHISTLSQDIQNLRFKFLLNECIFEKITGLRRKSDNVLESEFLEKTYAYFEERWDVFSILDEYGIDIEDKSFLGKIDTLNYFIVDSLACLSKISNTLQPLNSPTLFISYFLGDINLYTEFWKKLYDSLYLLYKNADCYIETGRLNTTKNAQRTEEVYSHTIRQNANYYNLCRYIANHHGEVGLAQRLKKYMQKKIDSVSMERLSWNYNAGLAIQNYSKAIEMHTEGRAYKDMIVTLYFLDDDLNNDTLQQQMAIERYLINSNNIQKRMQQMKKRVDKSKIYDVKRYVN